MKASECMAQMSRDVSWSDNEEVQTNRQRNK